MQIRNTPGRQENKEDINREGYYRRKEGCSIFFYAISLVIRKIQEEPHYGKAIIYL